MTEKAETITTFGCKDSLCSMDELFPAGVSPFELNISDQTIQEHYEALKAHQASDNCRNAACVSNVIADKNPDNVERCTNCRTLRNKDIKNQESGSRQRETFDAWAKASQGCDCCHSAKGYQFETTESPEARAMAFANSFPVSDRERNKIVNG